VNAYTLFPLNYWQIATFVALLVSVIGLWIAPRFWRSGLLAATVIGYIAGVLQEVAIVWLLLAWMACEIHARAPTEFGLRRILSMLSVVVIALLFGTHALPGFNNLLVIDHWRFTTDAEPFTLYLNFDKTVAGVLLLGVCYRDWPGRTGLLDTFDRRTGILLASNAIVLIGASYLLGYVRFEPKWTTLFWLWAAANLFPTCLSEEAFFRGFVLRELQAVVQSARYGRWLALVVSASLFGLVHFAGGWRYMLLSTLAGVGYGHIYQRTRRIECAMLAHFALNATHFLLFTYPRLA
jgi:uncharacterized protein